MESDDNFLRIYSGIGTTVPFHNANILLLHVCISRQQYFEIPSHGYRNPHTGESLWMSCLLALAAGMNSLVEPVLTVENVVAYERMINAGLIVAIKQSRN
jgi:hypothetical protein